MIFEILHIENLQLLSIQNYLVGLFQKAISLSGTALPPWTLPQKNTEKSIRLSALVGCPINSTRDMVKCLRKRPAHQLVHAMTNFLVNLCFLFMYILFSDVYLN